VRRSVELADLYGGFHLEAGFDGRYFQ